MRLSQLALRREQLESPQWVAVRFEMPVRIVQSKQNARLKELRRVLRSPGRASGVIGIEGPNLLEEAIRAGLKIHCVFASERFGAIDSEGLWSPTFATKQNREDGARRFEVLMVPAAILSSVLETEAPQPLAALIEAPRWEWADLTKARRLAPLLVVVAGVQDPGNLGTIMRSAEAFGANGIISLPGTVSQWNRKVMRASAGSVFRMPVIHTIPYEHGGRTCECNLSPLCRSHHGAKQAPGC